MTSNVLRGLAALCLLCVMPRLGATVMTINQSASFNVSRYVVGVSSVNAGAYWDFVPFDPAKGILESVTFSATVTMTVSAADLHWYPEPGIPPYPNQPREFTPYTQLHVSAYPMGSLGLGLTGSDISYGDRVLVQPGGLISHTATHVVTVSDTITDPAGLMRYSDPAFSDATIDTVSVGYGRYGGISIGGTIEASLTYNYRVPEAGATLAMLCAALLLLVFGRRLLLC